MRCYTPTQQGKALLGEESKTWEELYGRLERFGTARGLMRRIRLDLDQENARELRKTKSTLP
jgi:DNA-binding PadR family transcriptional regulator